jgi:hypothetical protein
VAKLEVCVAKLEVSVAGLRMILRISMSNRCGSVEDGCG